jgi:actin-related protein 3
MMNFDTQAVVIDNGTGYTKMGYTGNLRPSFDIPTLIAETGKKTVSGKYESSDQIICNNLDYCIGNDANNLPRSHYDVINPMKDGIIQEWGLMEKFWHRSIFDYLRCDPSETLFILTEPPFNPPENRENMAEIFF